jgi:hypothetical protein
VHADKTGTPKFRGSGCQFPQSQCHPSPRTGIALGTRLIKQMNIDKMVTCPNHILEFNNFHINEVIKSCYKLFTIEDIISNVEIWRHQYAIGILQQINDVFGDIMEVPTIHDDESMHDYSIISDWDQIRDDSTLVAMIDTQDLEGMVSLMDTHNDESVISLGNIDMSK